MPKLHRIFIDEKNINRDKFWTEDRKISDKIRKVLRLNRNDQIIIFDGKGNEYTARLTLVGKNKINGEIITHTPKNLLISPQIILAQALTRSNKIDQIIRMNTEIGVHSFIFFESDYSIVKLKDIKDDKMNRWTRVATEAARQSERLIVPEILAPVKFDDLYKTAVDKSLILHSKDETKSSDIREILGNLTNESSILIIIGPEGGFSKKEILYSIEKHMEIIHFNLPILRTETAGIAAVSFLLLSLINKSE